jgi:Arc/MetJ-type ribon-helix-helix transcriptional regulator
MYDSYIVKRTQIYLEEGQADELARQARTRGVTASHVIREAINDYLAKPENEAEQLARFRAALDQTFGIAPYLPPGDEYVAELRRADRRRHDDLERRWRG